MAIAGGSRYVFSGRNPDKPISNNTALREQYAHARACEPSRKCRASPTISRSIVRADCSSRLEGGKLDIVIGAGPVDAHKFTAESPGCDRMLWLCSYTVDCRSCVRRVKGSPSSRGFSSRRCASAVLAGAFRSSPASYLTQVTPPTAAKPTLLDGPGTNGLRWYCPDI